MGFVDGVEINAYIQSAIYNLKIQDSVHFGKQSPEKKTRYTILHSLGGELLAGQRQLRIQLFIEVMLVLAFSQRVCARVHPCQQYINVPVVSLAY